jgi:hypothetical protein
MGVNTEGSEVNQGIFTEDLARHVSDDEAGQIIDDFKGS